MADERFLPSSALAADSSSPRFAAAIPHLDRVAWSTSISPTALGGVGLTAAAFGSTSALLSRRLLSQAGALTPPVASLSIGMVLGCAIFGQVADRRGRRRALLLTAALLVAGSAGSAVSGFLSLNAELVFWHLLLGLGAGGEYPTVAAYVVEAALENEAARGSGRFCTRPAPALARVYSYLLWGPLLAAAWVSLGEALNIGAMIIWRFLFVACCAVAIFTLVLRWRCVRELVVAEAVEDSVGERTGLALVCRSSTALRRALTGSCVAWLLQGFVASSLELPTTILHVWGLSHSAQGEANVVLFSGLLSIPGYLVVMVWYAFERRRHQLVGFCVLSVGFVLLALEVEGPVAVRILIFTLLQTVNIASIGAAVHFVPAELFPTCVRASCVALSSVAGLVGRTLGMAVLPGIIVDAMALSCAATCFVGGVVTLMSTPTYNSQIIQELARLRPMVSLRESTIQALEQGDSFKQCPGCEVMVERETGCNVISCTNCDTVWCFACRGQTCRPWACASVVSPGPDLNSLPSILWPNTSVRSSPLVDTPRTEE